MKKFIIVVFILTIYLPMILSINFRLTGSKWDVTLKGYETVSNKPVFSLSTFETKEFQTNYNKWYESNFLPRGILVKTYSTIEYSLFHLGNRPIGYNNDIFENVYIYSSLPIGEAYDYSIKENQDEMQKMVNAMYSVQKKLAKYGKCFYLCIAPSKAEIDSKNLLNKWKAAARKNGVSAADYLKKLLSNSAIQYMFCSDMLDELEYPAFYSTGIHWSRTYEQLVSQRIIENLKEITSFDYRDIIFENVIKSYEPFWRDADVYNLLNVWNRSKERYYLYETCREYPEHYNHIRFLIQGDSFSEGLRKDILELYPYETVYYVNYNNYVQDSFGKSVNLNKSWENMDFQYYLDNTDVVIIEMSEANINRYTDGFVQQLDLFLDSYCPKKSQANYMKCLNVEDDFDWDYSNLHGIYERGKEYAWGGIYSQVVLQDNEIVNKGIELIYSIPEQVFYDSSYDSVIVYVNGEKILENKYNLPEDEDIVIAPELLTEAENNIYTIEMYSSSSFDPAKIGWSKTSRELALEIKYIGRVK